MYALNAVVPSFNPQLYEKINDALIAAAARHHGWPAGKKLAGPRQFADRPPGGGISSILIRRSGYNKNGLLQNWRGPFLLKVSISLMNVYWYICIFAEFLQVYDRDCT